MPWFNGLCLYAIIMMKWLYDDDAEKMIRLVGVCVCIVSKMKCKPQLWFFSGQVVAFYYF